jgi:hypothetical protein
MRCDVCGAYVVVEGLDAFVVGQVLSVGFAWDFFSFAVGMDGERGRVASCVHRELELIWLVVPFLYCTLGDFYLMCGIWLSLYLTPSIESRISRSGPIALSCLHHACLDHIHAALTDPAIAM